MAVLSSSSLRARKPQGLSALVIALSASIALLYYGRGFFITLITAVIIAFILDPFVALFMRLKIPRGLASFLVCSIALLVVYLGALGLVSQSSYLVEDLPAYSQRINDLVDGATQRFEAVERRAYELVVPRRLQEAQRPPVPPEETKSTARRRKSAEPPLPVAAEPAVQEVRIRPERSPIVDYIYSRLSSLYNALLMASFVPFLVYFMLSWRDHFRRSFLQIFEGKDRLAVGKSWEGIANMARAYVVGNFVLGLLLAIVSCLLFWALNLPYFLLLGFVSAFLSLIPYIGLPLAMIPPLFAALPVYHGLGAYIVIGGGVSFLHLLALNLFYPKIVGSRVHLNPLVVTVALMFWGAMWGAIGLVLAVPITAGIKAVCDNVSSLEAYGKLLGD
jgi:predicted PurR-regulated permease PerM